MFVPAEPWSLTHPCQGLNYPMVQTCFFRLRGGDSNLDYLNQRRGRGDAEGSAQNCRRLFRARDPNERGAARALDHSDGRDGAFQVSGCCWPTGVILRNEGRSAGLRDPERSLGGGVELLTGAGEPEWGALGVSADRPALAGVDDLAAERQHPVG